MKVTISFTSAMFVCLCKAVSERSIHAEIERGACSVEQIAACTGAGTGCGRCRPEIERLVERRAHDGRRVLHMIGTSDRAA